jgi:rhamnosyltransferase
MSAQVGFKLSDLIDLEDLYTVFNGNNNMLSPTYNKFKYTNFNQWKYLSHDWLIYFFARINNEDVFIDNNSYILYRIHNSNVHGQLNNISLRSYYLRYKLIINQWYFFQSVNFSRLLSVDSEEYNIYKMYNKNWFTRFYILIKYNFKLMRSKRKYIQFALISLIPRTNRMSSLTCGISILFFNLT